MQQESRPIDNTRVGEWIKKLNSKNGLERQKARENLVMQGRRIIPEVLKLLDRKQHILRWEAMKILEAIRDVSSIPVFIRKLEDDDSEIRWIAAEGLIRTGNRCVKPMLKRLIENPEENSIFIYSGAHHIFYDLGKEGALPGNFPAARLLEALKNPGWWENVDPMVYEILKNFRS